MISREDYIQLRAFARQEGLVMGALWIVTMACFIGSMKEALLEIGFVAGVVATPFVMYHRLRAFRDKVLGGTISYARATAFSAMAMGYGSLLIAAATMIYFYLIDNGLLMETLYNNIALPEVRESFRQVGMNPSELEAQIAEIGKLRPIDFAFSIFCNSIVSSFFLALFLGLAGRRSEK